MQQEYYVGSHEYPKKAAQNNTEEEAFDVQLALMFFQTYLYLQKKILKNGKFQFLKKFVQKKFFNILYSRNKIDKLIIRRSIIIIIVDPANRRGAISRP